MMTLTLLGIAAPTFWVSLVRSYEELLVCAALFGMAGNSFTVGVAWCSAWFPDRSKGTALGVFGAGNVGALVTKLIAPMILAAIPTAGLLGGIVPAGWRFVPVVYAALLVVLAAMVWFLSPTPDRRPGHGRPIAQVLAPLRHARVWRLGLYYVVVFGAYVALAAYLPRYYVDVYGLPLATAGYLTALFIFPASLLRPVGGWLSDRYGPRCVTYGVFLTMILALGLLSLPPSEGGMDAWSFTALTVVVGCAMGIGKASVFKYVPDYFPQDVGAVGGLVGMLGALGGFILPLAFGALWRWVGSPQAVFAALLALTLLCLCWLHVVVLRLNAAKRAARKSSLNCGPVPAST
jgi:NNP family nitrate/nitrite transporter-like MFS transporter